MGHPPILDSSNAGIRNVRVHKLTVLVFTSMDTVSQRGRSMSMVRKDATEVAMTEELTKLVEAARMRPFPEDEREAQRRSFAYGNAKIENDRVTWEMIVEADEKIKAELAAAK